MIDLTAWSLLVDILLMGSLIYLAYRLTRAESVAVKIDKVSDLERTLRKIINDAEESSILLDEKLRSRQKDLETLLEDLKSLEERVNASFKSSNTVKESLEHSLENGKTLMKKLATLASLANKQRQSDNANERMLKDNKIEVINGNSKNVNNGYIELSEPKNDNIVISNYKTSQAKSEVSKNDDFKSEEVAEKKYVVNKDFKASSYNTEKTKSALTSKIEKEVYETPKNVVSNTLNNDDLDVIKTLKNREMVNVLLKRGIPLSTISKKTNIPMNELLKMKDATALASDANKIVTSTDDARLGVLSKMRREIATL